MTVELKGYGKVTASANVLNLLSMVFSNAEKYQISKEHIENAEFYEECSEKIYDALFEKRLL